MKKRLLDYLACPECGQDLTLSSGRSEGIEIMSGDLRCTSCSVDYPIVEGIPRFADPDHVDAKKAEIARKFGFNWKHFPHKDERYAEQLLGWLTPVRPEFFTGKVVLDAGCGKGRHLNLAAAWGCIDVVGIDLSEAIELAFEESRGVENVHVIQADICRLPLKRAFDYAYSTGVLNLLPEPMAGFRSVASKIRPGGHLSVWLYSAENNWWLESFVTPVREHITSRMNLTLLLHLSKLPTAMVYVASKLIYGPLNRSAAGSKIARRLFYNDYMKVISRFGWVEHHHIVFDHLVAPTSYYLTGDEFKKWWRDIDVTDITIGWHNKNSWRGTGRIPQ